MEAPRPPFPFRSLCARCARNREIASSVRTERNDNFGRGLRIMMPILCPLGYYDRSLLHAILFVSQAIFFASFLACPLATPKSAGAMLANGHNNSCTSRRITVTAVSEELDLTSDSRTPIGRYQGLCLVGIYTVGQLLANLRCALFCFECSVKQSLLHWAKTGS